MTNVVERCYSCADDWGRMMIVRIAILGAMVVCTASLAMAEEVLYCVETDAAGFKWDNQGHATQRSFTLDRFTVKITSETERIITPMAGDIAGKADQYECKPVLSDKDQIICQEVIGGLIPLIFYHNTTFAKAFLAGPPAGGTDQNLVISYGTCTKF
jgi:hypothetical protein